MSFLWSSSSSPKKKKEEDLVGENRVEKEEEETNGRIPFAATASTTGTIDETDDNNDDDGDDHDDGGITLGKESSGGETRGSTSGEMRDEMTTTANTNNNNNNDDTNDKDDDDDDWDLPPWTIFHEKTCLANKTLVATARDVLQHHENEVVALRPRESETIVWDEKETDTVKQDAVVTAIIEALKERQNNNSNNNNDDNARQTSKSLSSSVASASWSVMSSVATSVYNFAMNKDEFEINAEAEEAARQHRDDKTEWSNNEDEPIGLDAPMISIETTLKCLDRITDNVLSVEVMTRHGFREWCQSVDGDFLGGLPDSQLSLLLEILAKQDQIGWKKEEGLVVLIPKPSLSSSSSSLTMGMTETEQETAIALYKIGLAEQHAEANIRQWTTEVDRTLVKAKSLKQRKRPQQALAELRKKALLERHIENASASLVNLEQTRYAIETAETQREVFRVLSDANSSLQDQRTQLSVDEVEDVAGDLQAELQALTDVNEQGSRTASDNGTMSLVEEEELLRELEELTTQSNDNVVSTDELNLPSPGKRPLVLKNKSRGQQNDSIVGNSNSSSVGKIHE